MKIVYAAILTIFLLLFTACGQKVNDPADVAAIKKTMDDFLKVCNAGDVNGIGALMTDKTYYAERNIPVAVGAKAIQALWQNFYDGFTGQFTLTVDDVHVAGDRAVARGTWTNKVTPKAQGVAFSSDSGNWVTAFVRQSDGARKFDWWIPSSIQPLSGSTASGEDEKALYQVGRDKTAAYAKKDAAVVERFLANEFVSNIDGRTADKKQFLAGIKANQAMIESAANSEMKAMIFGDTAVVHGLWIEKSTTSGKDTSFQARFTEVYVKRDGRWQCVTQYATKVQ